MCFISVLHRTLAPDVHRWANLPPELRAIKDRWLGSSSEAITLSEPAKNIDATVGVTAVQPAHGYLRDEQQLPQVTKKKLDLHADTTVVQMDTLELTFT